MNSDHCIDVCNKLLRGEQSAVGAYSKAIAAFQADNSVPEGLEEILDEHRNAVLALTKNIQSMGGEPAHDSGAWGAFASSVQGTANLLGDKSALASLKAGEKAGKADYESALEDDEVMPECKDLIRSSLLPATNQHIQSLELLNA